MNTPGTMVGISWDLEVRILVSDSEVMVLEW